MSETPLASVVQLGAFLQQDIDADSPSATLILDIASGMIRDYLEMELTYVTDEVVTLDPIEGVFVILPEMPVVDVTKVELFDGTAWTVLDPANYEVSRKNGTIAAIPYTGVTWPTGPETWRITYSHGYQTIPNGLVGICLGVAARAYSTPFGVESERIGGYQVKYAMESAGFNGIETKALRKYRHPAVA